jgi:hypothetical protein
MTVGSRHPDDTTRQRPIQERAERYRILCEIAERLGKLDAAVREALTVMGHSSPN